MSIGSREDYIRYRMQRAEQTLEDARLLVENEKWNAAVNRLYYACFYAVSALLLKNGFSSQTHDGARTLFGQHFVKNGLVEKKYGKLYSKLFDHRQKGDYGDLYDFDRDAVEPLMGPVSDFVDCLKGLI